MQNRTTYKYLLPFFPLILSAQSADSTSTQIIDEVVVSGNTFIQPLGKVAVPIMIVDQKQILQAGSKRLDEILFEQTGLSIIQNHGTGVQIQGMGTEYTLILINGNPLIGRTAGTFDLSRIAVSNIERIEITKGPSSSLFGSDALAGVINIITKTPRKEGFNLNVRYGTNATVDVNADVSFKRPKYSAKFYANRLSSEGYGFNNDEYRQTVSPYENYTSSLNIDYNLSSQWKFNLYSRFYREDARYKMLSFDEKINGSSVSNDYNIAPKITWMPTGKVESELRLYHSIFENRSEEYLRKANQLHYSSTYRESYSKAENFTKFKWGEQFSNILGAGIQHQSIKADRYEEEKTAQQYYILGQLDADWWENLVATAGVRYDHNSAFGSQINPKLSIKYAPLTNLSLRASAGRGFKAPDFRQLYLNFTNNIVGYSVFGTQVVADQIEKFQREGQINTILVSADKIKDLKAERSWSYNIGVHLKALKKLEVDINGFRNNIDYLINTIAIATKSNGQSVFSYVNLNRVFTRGIESEITYKPFPNLRLSAGYQYLEAKDQDKLNKIHEGILYGNDDHGQPMKIHPSDYFGVIGRSKHSYNAKMYYQNFKAKFFGNIRAVYRGEYGFHDQDGNGIINNKNELAPGYFLLNATFGKKIAKALQFQIGCDNITNFTNVQYNPEFSGRQYWVSLQYSIN